MAQLSCIPSYRVVGALDFLLLKLRVLTGLYSLLLHKSSTTTLNHWPTVSGFYSPLASGNGQVVHYSQGLITQYSGVTSL